MRSFFPLFFIFASITFGQVYVYDESADFPLREGNRTANLSTLKFEIEQSSIATSLKHLTKDVDTLSIVFEEALSSEDKTTLDGDTSDPAGGLIAAHDSSSIFFSSVDSQADTTSTSYTSRIAWTTPVVSGPTVILAYCEVMAADLSNDAVEVRLHDVTGDTDLAETQVATRNGDWVPIAFTGFKVFSEERRTLTLDWRADGAGVGTVSIRRARLFLGQR